MQQNDHSAANASSVAGLNNAAVVLTVATPDYAKEWQFCINSQRKYCGTHHYRYIVRSEPLPGLHPKWSKLQYTIDELAKGEPVMLIDADAEFARDAPAFHELLAAHPNHDILFSRGVSGRLNSGVMIFRPGEASVASDYLKACLARRHVPVAKENFVTIEGENGHLIELIAEEPYASRAMVIGREWNCTSPECYANAIIRHYTGPLRQAAQRNELRPAPKGFRRSSTLRARVLRKAQKLLRLT